MINSKKASGNSEKEESWAKIKGETFQRWAGVVLLTFGDVLTCGQNGLKNKGFYNNYMFLHFTHTVIVKVLFNKKLIQQVVLKEYWNLFNPSLFSIYLNK